MMTPEQARELARRVVALTAADQAECFVAAETNALTRFANSRINQNVAEEDALISVRAVVGKRVGVASTNRLDDESLRRATEAAVTAARVSPEDPEFLGLPGPALVTMPQRAFAATRGFDAEARARAAGAIIEQSSAHGLSAAGKVRAAEHVTAVANSLGVDVGMAVTGAQATVLSAGHDGGSGWASFLDADAANLTPDTLGRVAADLALRSASPGALVAGTYTVVLGPEAVADILDFLAYVGFSAKAVDEGRSFMSGRSGQKLMSELVSIADDALGGHAMGTTFDFEGQPKVRVPLVERGVIGQPVTDSYWAAKLGVANTGHALPAPNTYGPMPANLEVAAGDATLDELIGSVKSGVYVTRFHYVNVEDPISVLLTGMTRDGTFAIENGKLGRPLKNLRFTQSAVDALANCQGVTRERTFVGTEEGASYVPALLLGTFAFTGQTA
ncbi:MAG: TldD/PmbA family protein [Coriobacteriia bacterium]|nr:TldD/PmbA family protein [Coriobacteriia bacterium]